jgi:hypothetical protein
MLCLVLEVVWSGTGVARSERPQGAPKREIPCQQYLGFAVPGLSISAQERLATASVQRCPGFESTAPEFSGDTEAGEDRNLDQIQDYAECNRCGKLASYDCNRQSRHCDSETGKCCDDEDIRCGR